MTVLTVLSHQQAQYRLQNYAISFKVIMFIAEFALFCWPHEAICNAWWRHQMETFPRYWPFVRGIHRSTPVNSLHKGQWRRALMFSLICAWINGSVNNREADDLRRHRAHYDVYVMQPRSHRTSNVKLVGTWIPFTAVHPRNEGKWVFYLLEPDQW